LIYRRAPPNLVDVNVTPEEGCIMSATAQRTYRAHITPDPETPPPQPEKDPPPDNYPTPEHAPIEEPEPPKTPVKTAQYWQ
jgi:protein TonB